MEKGENAARFGVAAGALLMAAGLVLDAWYAHGLSHSLAPERASAFESAVRQQLLAATGLLATGLWHARGATRWTRLAGPGFFLSALLFSGSIYLRELTGAEGWVSLAPWGGSLQILSWLLLGIGALRGTRAPDRGAGTQI